MLLKSTSTHLEILEGMRNPISGLSFLITHQSLPSYTFIAADAVNWLIGHLEGVNNAEKAVYVRILNSK